MDFAPEIDEQGRLLDIGIAVAEAIEEGQRRQVDSGHLDALLLDLVIDVIERVGLDRHQRDFALRPGFLPDELVVPDDFVDREGHILPGLELDDLVGLVVLEGRQLHEAREDHMARDGIPHVAALELELLRQFQDRHPQLRQPGRPPRRGRRAFRRNQHF